MTEVWKDIPGYEGIYQASTLGRIRSLNRTDCTGRSRDGWVMSCIRNRDGYYSIKLSKQGKGISYLVHRLVAMTFIPNDENLPLINHKDENPSNNCVANLEWCDYKYNANYGKMTHEFRSRNVSRENHPRRKLSQKQVDEIRYKNQNRTSRSITAQLAKEYGVGVTQIRNIISYRQWIE